MTCYLSHLPTKIPADNVQIVLVENAKHLNLNYMKNNSNPISWTEIAVENMDRAQEFYQEVFKIKLEKLAMPEMPDLNGTPGEVFEMVSFPGNMTGPGSSGALVKSEFNKPGPGGTLVYFECEDCAVEISRVWAAGGKVLQEKMSIGQYGFCGTCLDTEGNTIGFHSMS